MADAVDGLVGYMCCVVGNMCGVFFVDGNMCAGFM